MAQEPIKYVSMDIMQENVSITKEKLAEKQDIMQVTTMPILTSENITKYAMKLIQYIGATNANYSKGCFYEVDSSDPSNYVWVKSTYNKADVDRIAATKSHWLVVSELPTTNIDTTAMYLVPAMENKEVYVDSTNGVCYIEITGASLTYAKFNSTTGKYIENVTGVDAEAVASAIQAGTYVADNITVEFGYVDGTKDEYVCLDATSDPVKWEKIGSTGMDLTGYLKAEDLVPITQAELEAMWEN